MPAAPVSPQPGKQAPNGPKLKLRGLKSKLKHKFVGPERKKSVCVMDAPSVHKHLKSDTPTGLVAFGKNDFGQLGTGDKVDHPRPNLANFFQDKEVMFAACGRFLLHA